MQSIAARLLRNRICHATGPGLAGALFFTRSRSSILRPRHHCTGSSVGHAIRQWGFSLQLNQANISVSGQYQAGQLSAALQSPPTRSTAAPTDLLQEALDLFGLSADQLCPKLPPALIHAGADHLLLAVQERATLSAMRYSLAAGRD
jgi:predicted PhzF superfamily epimerase YddE/YHI9